MDAPWSSKATLQTTDSLVRLSKEILDFEKYIEPTKNEKLNRDTLFYSTTQLINSLWPDNKTTAFGSFVTGLQFPSSDIDINIDFEVMPKNNKIDVLKIIRKKLAAEGIFQNRRMRLVATAKIPVLMATDDNEISMDVTVQNESLSSNRTATWIKEYPALKPLFMVLKQSISTHRVSSLPTFEPLSAKTAGLASYSLICMIVSFLQLQVDPSFKSSDPSYYGTLLIGFLVFYSNFDNEKQAISLNNGGAYLTKDKCPIELQTKTGKLTIVDPDVEGANVARSTLRFDTIQLIFAHMVENLQKRISINSNYGSILSSIIKIANSHYYGEPRSEGVRFKVKYTWIETGRPKSKAAKRYAKHNNINNKYRGGTIHRAGEGHYRDRGFNNHRNPYNRNSHNDFNDDRSQDQDFYSREYQRHQHNNRSHLAEHYRKKATKNRTR
ncbi:MAG: hypothetical protein EXX96DRAFT_541403 [Benjaminiella poitrasii]|nr:MAG: hypothetical protein EXX96DRAFT_541403 [Benjaminiella poitrasii]